MAITNFVPELWEAAVQAPFEKALVYGQPTVANTDYEGKIKEMGDTVHVTSIADPTIRTYDKTVDLTVEDLADSDLALVVDQGDYFAFGVNDVDAVQAAGDFEGPGLSQAGIGLRDKVDRYLAGLLYPGGHTDNRVGRVAIVDAEPEFAGTGQVSAYSVLVKLRQKLDKKSVPLEGRYCTVPPEFISALSYDKRFTDMSASGSTETLRNGFVTRVQGFDLLVSNNVPTVGGGGANANDLVIAAGVPGALSFANQISKTEGIRDPKRFRDIVRGLNIYGGKVFRPAGIATATATFAAPAV